MPCAEHTKKRFSVLGDSVSTFEGFHPDNYRVYYESPQCETTGVMRVEDTWWHQVIQHFDGELLANASFSGSMVEGGSFPAGDSNERVAALSREGITPDVILVAMGINDYGWGSASAQAAGRGAAVPPERLAQAPDHLVVPGLVGAGALQQFKAAYHSLLERLRAAYPQAEVWCCTLCPGRVAESARATFVYCYRGVLFDNYNQAIREAAHEKGHSVVDVRALGLDYEAIDGTHPTAQGMRQLAAMVIAARENVSLLTSETERERMVSQLSAECGATRSVEHCLERPCVGCEHALSTSNAWMLICENPAEG